MLTVVPIYAALLFLALSVAVIRLRRERRVPLGTSGDSGLERRVRVHANFAEYVPIALLLLAMAELRDAPTAVLHLLCAGLLIGRLAHAWGVPRAVEDYRFRVAGTGATLAAIGVAALLILVG